jgi:hypothetical protein
MGMSGAEVAERPLAERLEAVRLAQAIVASEDGPPGVARLTLDQIRHPPREHFVIGSLFPLAKTSVFFGPTGTGKSALLSQLAFAFAAGAESLWGLPLLPDGGPVLVYTAEDSLEDWARKGAAALVDAQIDMESAIGNLHIIDQTEGLARLSEVVTIRSGEAEVVTKRVARPTAEQDFVITVANAIGARLVLLETTSRLVDEEDNANFSALQSAAGRIGRGTGAAVILTHHATKQASKDNEPTVEAARGGGALIANARNAVALFEADKEEAKRYAGRFPADDLFQLWHLKGTSSTRRQAPLTLVRCDARHGAAFRLPDDVAFSPEQEQANAARVDVERQRDADALRRLYEVVERMLPLGAVSPSRLREHVTEIGIQKRRLDALVSSALDLGILKSLSPATGGRGVRLGLGHDPRKPIREVA